MPLLKSEQTRDLEAWRGCTAAPCPSGDVQASRQVVPCVAHTRGGLGTGCPYCDG